MWIALVSTFVSYDTMKVWYWKFKNKDYNIQEADVDEARLRALVKDKYSTIWDLAKKTDIKAMSISRDIIKLMYKFNNRVLHELTLADTDRHV